MSNIDEQGILNRVAICWLVGTILVIMVLYAILTKSAIGTSLSAMGTALISMFAITGFFATNKTERHRIALRNLVILSVIAAGITYLASLLAISAMEHNYNLLKQQSALQK